MSGETPVRQQSESAASDAFNRDITHETLKSLARRVLNSTVSADSPLCSETQRQQPEEPETLARHQRDRLYSDSELQASRERLEARQISIAVWPDGFMRVVAADSVGQAWRNGGTVYQPDEMFAYIHLSHAERALVRAMKGLKQRGNRNRSHPIVGIETKGYD